MLDGEGSDMGGRYEVGSVFRTLHEWGEYFNLGCLNVLMSKEGSRAAPAVAWPDSPVPPPPTGSGKIAI